MSCSKIFSGDLPELTREIIKYFHNDYSTLHSCILVNRLWCRLAIPLLWENPFSIHTGNYNFIDIYLYYLNSDLKTQLNEYGIIHNLSNTMFNYPRFLKYLNTHKLISSVAEYTTIRISKLNEDLLEYLFKELVHLSLFNIFIENEVNLHTFEIETPPVNHSYHEIFKSILKNANFIHNIRNLELYINKYNTGENASIENNVSQMINLKQNLKKIMITSNYVFYLYKSLLTNCSNTLNTIIFYQVNFEYIINLNQIFEQLNVLESVHIIYCWNLNYFTKQIINLTKPFKLKSLIMYEKTQIETFQFLLENFGDGIETINHDESLKQSLELILEYCKNIKYFEFYGFKSHIIYQMFYLIENTKQNLNYLSISIGGDDLLNNSSIVLQNLGSTLPSKLEYLCLDLIIKEDDFRVFIENSKTTFINKLMIIQINSSDNVLHYIKKYIMKEKKVKYLAISGMGNNRELFDLKDEVKEFKLHNIEVQSYRNLHLTHFNAKELSNL